MYFPNPVKTGVNFIIAIPTGLDDGAQEVANIRPFGTPPIDQRSPYGVGGPPVNAGSFDSTGAPISPASAPAGAAPCRTRNRWPPNRARRFRRRRSLRPSRHRCSRWPRPQRRLRPSPPHRRSPRRHRHGRGRDPARQATQMTAPWWKPAELAKPAPAPAELPKPVPADLPMPAPAELPKPAPADLPAPELPRAEIIPKLVPPKFDPPVQAPIPAELPKPVDIPGPGVRSTGNPGGTPIAPPVAGAVVTGAAALPAPPQLPALPAPPPQLPALPPPCRRVAATDRLRCRHPRRCPRCRTLPICSEGSACRSELRRSGEARAPSEVVPPQPFRPRPGSDCRRRRASKRRGGSWRRADPVCATAVDVSDIRGFHCALPLPMVSLNNRRSTRSHWRSFEPVEHHGPSTSPTRSLLAAIAMCFASHFLA